MSTHHHIQPRLRPRPAGPETLADGRRGAPFLAPARVAGLLYFVVIGFGLFAEVVVRSRLVVDGNPEATAANILGSEWLFRLGFAADLVVFLADVALAVLLYVVFRPVDRTLSLLAAAFRLTQTAIIGLNLLNMFGALLILRDAPYLEEPEARALFLLDTHTYGYVLGLTFFGVGTLLIGALALRSGIVPRALGVLLLLAGGGYLADSAAFFLVPGYDGSVSPILLAPAIVAEVWFAVWLVLRGQRLGTGTASLRQRGGSA